MYFTYINIFLANRILIIQKYKQVKIKNREFVRMNEVFLVGKLITEVEVKFIIHSKSTSKVKFSIEKKVW